VDEAREEEACCVGEALLASDLRGGRAALAWQGPGETLNQAAPADAGLAPMSGTSTKCPLRNHT
jgi:hypothetical protein